MEESSYLYFGIGMLSLILAASLAAAPLKPTTALQPVESNNLIEIQLTEDAENLATYSALVDMETLVSSQPETILFSPAQYNPQDRKTNLNCTVSCVTDK